MAESASLVDVSPSTAHSGEEPEPASSLELTAAEQDAVWRSGGCCTRRIRLSTTLEYEADPTLENEATGSSSPSLPRLGF